MYLVFCIFCVSYPACGQFVLLAGAAAVVEFCISMVLFSSHHQLSTVSAHVREVMRRPLPSISEVRDLQLSEHEQRAFYRAMGWLDEMGNLDERRVQLHYFSWSQRWNGFTEAVRDQTMQILIKNEWIVDPGELWNQDVEERGRKKDGGFQPLCARGRSSLRRRGVMNTLAKGAETIAGQFGTAINEFAADMSADEAWHSLAEAFDHIWNLQNISLSAKAYERPGLTEEEVMEIKEAFDLFDTDGGGSIDPKGTASPM